jgi:hypothetical protein
VNGYRGGRKCNCSTENPCSICICLISSSLNSSSAIVFAFKSKQSKLKFEGKKKYRHVHFSSFSTSPPKYNCDWSDLPSEPCCPRSLTLLIHFNEIMAVTTEFCGTLKRTLRVILGVSQGPFGNPRPEGEKGKKPKSFEPHDPFSDIYCMYWAFT